MHWILAWKIGLRSVGWLLPLTCTGIIFAALVTTAGDLQVTFLRLNALEVVLPLFVGIQSALLFAPDDEPTLELMLVKPRPMQWVLYERLAALILIYGIIGVTASLLLTLLPNAEPLRLTFTRWLPPTLCMIGVGIWASTSTRRTSTGVFVALMLCAAMAIGQSVLLPRYEFMSWVMFYVQPWDVTTERYTANRIIVLLIGVITFALTTNLMRDSETMLGINKAVTT